MERSSHPSGALWVYMCLLEARSYVWTPVVGGEDGARYATATIFPSVEYVDEWQTSHVVRDFGGMVQTAQPVWRSQLANPRFSPNAVNRRPSGEKLSQRVVSVEGKVLIRPRVIASKISITAGLWYASATNLLHGDHATATTAREVCIVAAVCSHEVGKPHTTLARGRAYGSYSWRTIDVFGDRKSAE